MARSYRIALRCMKRIHVLALKNKNMCAALTFLEALSHMRGVSQMCVFVVAWAVAKTKTLLNTNEAMLTATGAGPQAGWRWLRE